MPKYHEIDAPDIQIDASPVDDNSALTEFYPDPPKDTRPLLKSDAERHALQQERLNRSVDGVLIHGFSIASLQTIPFAYVAILGAFVYENLTASTATLLLPVIVIGGFFWLAVLVYCYRIAMERLHRHGISGLSVGLITLISLATGGSLTMSASLITNSYVLNSVIFSGYLLAIAVATTYLLLFIAVNSYHRGSGQG